MKTKTKNFDCVRMARECNEWASQLLKGMSASEEIAFLEKYRSAKVKKTGDRPVAESGAKPAPAVRENPPEYPSK